jgi:hypothetical protein
VSSIPVSLEGGGVGLSWEFIRHCGEVDVAVALRSLLQVMLTLGVRHREFGKPFGALCPANLLFTRDGSALFPGVEQRLPQPLRYLAPECRTGLAPTPQADLFALGVLLLETLSGRALEDEEVLTLSDARALAGSQWAAHWAAYSSDELCTVALRALSLEPEHRWASVDEFADALVLAAGRRIGPKLSLAALVGSTLARQGERATPLVPPLLAAVPHVPKAPAAPRFALQEAEQPLEAKFAAPSVGSLTPSVPSAPVVSAVSGAHTLNSLPVQRRSARRSGMAYLAAAAALGVAVGAWRLLAPDERPAPTAGSAASEVLAAASSVTLGATAASSAREPQTPLLLPAASATAAKLGAKPEAPRSNEGQTLSEAAQRALRPAATALRSASGAVSSNPSGTAQGSAKPVKKRNASQTKGTARNAEQRYDPEGI